MNRCRVNCPNVDTLSSSAEAPHPRDTHVTAGWSRAIDLVLPQANRKYLKCRENKLYAACGSPASRRRALQTMTSSPSSYCRRRLTAYGAGRRLTTGGGYISSLSTDDDFTATRTSSRRSPTSVRISHQTDVGSRASLRRRRSRKFRSGRASLHEGLPAFKGRSGGGASRMTCRFNLGGWNADGSRSPRVLNQCAICTGRRGLLQSLDRTPEVVH
jgi:hypothetical protein